MTIVELLHSAYGQGWYWTAGQHELRTNYVSCLPPYHDVQTMQCLSVLTMSVHGDPDEDLILLSSVYMVALRVCSVTDLGVCCLELRFCGCPSIDRVRGLLILLGMGSTDSKW